MSLYPRKRDLLNNPPSTPLNPAAVFNAGASSPHPIDVPKPNQFSMVSHTRLIHNLNNLNDLFWTIVIDLKVAEFIQKKTPAFSENYLTRTKITLDLLDRDNSLFKVDIWLIPLFSDGVMVNLLYAADDENQQILLERRNPAKPNRDYDIAQF